MNFTEDYKKVVIHNKHITICGKEITVTQYDDGTFIIERSSTNYGWWVVCDLDKNGNYFVHDNKADGEIEDIVTGKGTLLNAMCAIVSVAVDNYLSFNYGGWR